MGGAVYLCSAHFRLPPGCTRNGTPPRCRPAAVSALDIGVPIVVQSVRWLELSLQFGLFLCPRPRVAMNLKGRNHTTDAT